MTTAIRHSKNYFLVVLLLYPAIGKAQGGNSRLADENQATKQAVVNTVFPILLGYGSTQIFNSQALQVSGATLAIYGAVFGPSYGNFYANDFVRGISGVAARIAGSILLKNATREVMGDQVSDAFGWDDKKVTFDETKIWVGTAIMAGSALYNILSAKKSAREYNQKLGVITHVMPSPGTGKIVPAVTVTVTF